MGGTEQRGVGTRDWEHVMPHPNLGSACAVEQHLLREGLRRVPLVRAWTMSVFDARSDDTPRRVMKTGEGFGV
eukprot:1870164-Rhodomonas_salina.3